VQFNTSDTFRFNRFVNDTRQHLSNSPIPESSFYIRTANAGVSTDNEERADSLVSP